jgi:hypothetical protein
VIILSVVLVLVSVTVTVVVPKLVIVKYRLTVDIGKPLLDGIMATATTIARRHTVVSVRASCRFMNPIQRDIYSIASPELSLLKVRQ